MNSSLIHRVLLALLAVCILAWGASAEEAAKSKVQAMGKGGKETVVTLKTTQGDILLHFFPDLAPEHVKNFIEHSKSGYYTGTTFHRVIPGFMIQGGDPNSKDSDPANDGMGGDSYKGPGTMLKAEFSQRPHKRGILSMARSNELDSAGSQFFICHADATFLDGKYTVFGETISGLDVVDKIANIERDKRDRPLKDQKILEVKVEEWPAEKVRAALEKQKAAEASTAGKAMDKPARSTGK